MLFLLVISVAALGVAPQYMPDTYSWIANTTSESAAQGLEYAWIARLGFVFFGFGVILLSHLARSGWSTLAKINHVLFGAMMVLAAAFSHRHWVSEVPFDQIEDQLHSVSATLMGFVFSFGVIFCFLRRREDRIGKGLDLIALAAAIFIPLAMLFYDNIDGLIQRVMFGLSYVWYMRETLKIKNNRYLFSENNI